jgi:hypothetical protein
MTRGHLARKLTLRLEYINEGTSWDGQLVRKRTRRLDLVPSTLFSITWINRKHLDRLDVPFLRVNDV